MSCHNIPLILRCLGAAALIYLAYDDIGPWASLIFVLIFIGLEVLTWSVRELSDMIAEQQRIDIDLLEFVNARMKIANSVIKGARHESHDRKAH